MVEAVKRFGTFVNQKIEALPDEYLIRSGGCAHGYHSPWLVAGELYLTNRRLIWTTIRPLGRIVEIPPDQVISVEAFDHRLLYLTWRRAWLVETPAKKHLFTMDWWGVWGTRDRWIEAIREWSRS